MVAILFCIANKFDIDMGQQQKTLANTSGIQYSLGMDQLHGACAKHCPEMKINFFRCNIADGLDVDVYAADPIMDWLRTEHGQWVKANAYDLTYHHRPDSRFWGYDVIIRGEITDPQKITEYFLRWPERP